MQISLWHSPVILSQSDIYIFHTDDILYICLRSNLTNQQSNMYADNIQS